MDDAHHDGPVSAITAFRLVEDAADNDTNEWRYVLSKDREAFRSVLLQKLYYIHIVSGGRDGRLCHWKLRRCTAAESRISQLPMHLELCCALTAHRDEVTQIEASHVGVVYSGLTPLLTPIKT